jgi:leucyl aminopeptidase
MTGPATDFSPTPSLVRSKNVSITVAEEVPAGATVVAVPVATDGAVADELELDRATLGRAGFDAKAGQTLVIARRDGPTCVAVGIGERTELDGARIRDAAAAFARAALSHEHLALRLAAVPGVTPELFAQVVVEGILLARYRYDALTAKAPGPPVSAITLVGDDPSPAVARGAERGRALAAATQLSRDLANTPPVYLTATGMAEVATGLAAERGLEVEVFEKDALVELGCGGLLGVNRGSADPPTMIKLTYTPRQGEGEPAEPTGRLTLVGKGITYDSGGIALKPADATHATMKNDMTGAGSILAAMAALGELGCRAAVTGYLMCTDNRPSGTAMALGDVITIHGGTTVEVANTDAEGRLVMADALVMATEEPTDAIVDIATLTGACLRALGTQVAGVLGNNQPLVDQIVEAADATDESVWQLPLERRYRKELDTPIADIKNLGGPNAGAITAALFLDEFVAGRPFAHIDIAGTAQNDADDSWRTAGCTGFGARLLAELAVNFRPPGS